MNQLWTNGIIYTMESEFSTVEAVLVEEGEIRAVGTFEALKNQADEVIDLHGATMYPGFVDSHLHMIAHGEKLQRLDLSQATSAEQILALVSEAAKTLEAGQWLLGEGWNENNFYDGLIPTKEELDKISKVPILLTRVCHHVVLANSTALAAGHITAQTSDPLGGKIGRHADGNLNGLLYELAINIITDAIPKEGEAYINSLETALYQAVDNMLSHGLTGGHTEEMSYFGPYTNPLTAYQRVIGNVQNFRVHLLRHHNVFQEMMDAYEDVQESFVELGAMKIFADGSFGGSTAALLSPYANDENSKGMLIHTDEQMEQLIKLARDHQEAVAIHMIGDAGVEQVLALLEKHPVFPGKRDRLIHCCLVTPEQIERMKKLPVILDLQPAFVPSDFPWVLEKIGSQRTSLAYAWKTFIDEGLMCAAGTDAPIEAISPMETIYAAVERKKSGDTHDGYIPEEKVSRFEAVKMYTVGSAQAICKEHKRGQIKVGYDADFTIFDRDLFAGTTEDMRQAKALKTVVAGNVVFNRNTN
ncbi:amidohydrolase [Solibacillus sp. R5-41]|uniref:amidohydrolase n=1 Tax=Solibacillus sp. R5-41 TaxID=2048654 RepID=UPI000C124DE7|nr:amidohydrolase [Solibacillus sp. R5-41]ATP42109.1 amidohydrolase [Solibacillus sp. R5-41]